MAKDKNKVAPADGALVETVWKSTGVKQGSAKRRNRKAWPGDEEQEKSPKSGKRRDSKKKKKSKSKEETKEETSSPQRGKQFKAPTQKRQSGLNGAADAVKASLAAVGGPSDKYAMAAEESYEDRQKRLKEAERKRRAEKRSKRFKKLWQMFGVQETIKLETVAAREAVNALNLTQKDLKHLKREFDEIDVDQSGSMDAVEFFDMLDEERTPLTDELFALMDLDGSGTIEFDEFIAVLLTYCMYTKDDILRFCFDTFDKDKSNSIDENEFMALLSTVNNGAPLFPGNMGTALMNFDSNDDGLIDFQEFKVIETRYPMIFFPAFRLQDRMQQKTLGETRWRDLMKSVQKQRFKNEHRRTHGRDPPLTYAETIQKVVCCKRPKEYDIQVIDSKRPSITSAIEAAEKKKAIMEGGKKKRSSQAEDD